MLKSRSYLACWISAFYAIIHQPASDPTFNDSNLTEICVSPEDKRSTVTNTYWANEKNNTPDEATCGERDDFLETRQYTGGNTSAQRPLACSKCDQGPSLEQSIKETRRRQRENLCTPRNWKPVTLQYHALSAFIIILLSLLAILEVLYHFSKGDNGGGLAFGATADQLSTLARFSYLYLPTVLAVLYSIAMELDRLRREEA
jgi:hypothetical protein